MELIISILVRILLGLLLLIDFLIIKRAFGKHVLLGLVVLGPIGALGLALLALIIS